MSHESNLVWKEFEENEITHSVAHYLMAIDELKEDLGYARAVDISKELEISAASCSNWLKSLLKKWLIIEDKNRFISLSEEWQQAAEKIKKNREFFIKFFRETLGANMEESVVNACKIEHLISPHITRKLWKFLWEEYKNM